jgi:LSD1 subclass zinc finger protein
VTLEPLRCAKCNAAVPLLGAKHFTCPYCNADVHVPHDYRALFAVHERELAARRELEQRFAAVARPPRRWVDRAAVLLLFIVPSLAPTVWVHFARDQPSIVGLFAGLIVPGVLPGAIVWMWSLAVHATIVRFQLALACDPPANKGEPPRCRGCGAPLHLESGAISAHCAYCGTDSLIDHAAAAARRIGSQLHSELRTLGQAIEALHVRKRLIVGGIAVVAVLAAALSLAVLHFIR